MKINSESVKKMLRGLIRRTERLIIVSVIACLMRSDDGG